MQSSFEKNDDLLRRGFRLKSINISFVEETCNCDRYVTSLSEKWLTNQRHSFAYEYTCILERDFVYDWNEFPLSWTHILRNKRCFTVFYYRILWLNEYYTTLIRQRKVHGCLYSEIALFPASHFCYKTVLRLSASVRGTGNKRNYTYTRSYSNCFRSINPL